MRGDSQGSIIHPFTHAPPHSLRYTVSYPFHSFLMTRPLVMPFRILCLAMSAEAITGSESMAESEETSKKVCANTEAAVNRFIELEPVHSPELKGLVGESPRESDSLVEPEPLLEPLTRPCMPDQDANAAIEVENINLSMGPGIKFHCVHPQNLDPDKDFALIMHWSKTGHQKVALAIADVVDDFMGWSCNRDAMVAVPEHEIKGPAPSCCWKGTCVSNGRCYCAIM